MAMALSGSAWNKDGPSHSKAWAVPKECIIVRSIVSVCGTFENLMRQNACIFSSESYAAQMRPIAKWPHSQKNSVSMLQNARIRMPHAAYPHTAYGTYGAELR
jgi:hypothetical protein